MPTATEILNSLLARQRALEAAFNELKASSPGPGQGGGKCGAPISGRYCDIHDLVSEATGWTPLSFEASVTSSSITQPTRVNTRTDRKFFLWGMAAYHDAPGSDLADMYLLTFNVKVNSTDQLFHNDLNVAQLLNPLGSGGIFAHKHGGGTLIDPGSTLDLSFARASGFSGNTRKVGVTLWGDYLR